MSEKILCLKQQTLSDIADSIRSQTGSVELIPISDLDDAIENMAHQFNAQEDSLICGTITSYVNETATKIRDYAFHKMSSLTSASFAAATSIGYSFDGCENLEQISLPGESFCTLDNSENPHKNGILYYTITRNSDGTEERYSVNLHNLKGEFRLSFTLNLYDRVVFNYGGGMDGYLSNTNTSFEGHYIDSTHAD